MPIRTINDATISLQQQITNRSLQRYMPGVYENMDRIVKSSLKRSIDSLWTLLELGRQAHDAESFAEIASRLPGTAKLDAKGRMIAVMREIFDGTPDLRQMDSDDLNDLGRLITDLDSMREFAKSEGLEMIPSDMTLLIGQKGRPVVIQSRAVPPTKAQQRTLRAGAELTGRDAGALTDTPAYPDSMAVADQVADQNTVEVSTANALSDTNDEEKIQLRDPKLTREEQDAKAFETLQVEASGGALGGQSVSESLDRAGKLQGRFRAKLGKVGRDQVEALQDAKAVHAKDPAAADAVIDGTATDAQVSLVDAKVDERVKEVEPKRSDPHAHLQILASVAQLTTPSEANSVVLPAQAAITGTDGGVAPVPALSKDGKANPLSTGGALMNDLQTIETWIRADWDPATRQDAAAIVTLSGPIVGESTKEAEFSLLLSADAKNLIVVTTGGDIDSPTVVKFAIPYDFSDKKFHHVTMQLSQTFQFMRVAFDDNEEIKITAPGENNRTPTVPSINYWVDLVTVGSRGGAEIFEGRIATLSLWDQELSLHDALNPPSDPYAALVFSPQGTFPTAFVFGPRKAGLKGVWVSEFVRADADNPGQRDMGKISPRDHCQYDEPRFVTICTGPDAAWHLVTDGGADVSLTPAPGTLGVFTTAAAGDLPALRVEAVRNRLEFATGYQVLFSVQITAADGGSEAGPAACPFDSYTRPLVRPDVTATSIGDSVGSLFGNFPKNMDRSMTGYDIRNMDPRDLAAKPGRVNDVFALPPAKTANYSNVPVLLPYGWKYTAQFQSTGTYKSYFIGSGSELRNTTTNETSWNVGLDGFSYNTASVYDSTEGTMTSGETKYSEHWTTIQLWDLVLDKVNVSFSAKYDGGATPTLVGGFLFDAERYRKGLITADQLIEQYGTHYPYAVRYGGKGIARISYLENSIEKLLETGQNVSWGARFHVSESLGGGTPASVSFDDDAGYSSSEGKKSFNTMKADAEVELQSFQCTGGQNGCSDGKADASDPLPIMMDLRPISDLLAPPFFSDYETCVTARNRLLESLHQTLDGKDPDGPVFDYYMVRVKLHNADLSGGPKGNFVPSFPNIQAAISVVDANALAGLPDRDPQFPAAIAAIERLDPTLAIADPTVLADQVWRFEAGKPCIAIVRLLGTGIGDFAGVAADGWDFVSAGENQDRTIEVFTTLERFVLSYVATITMTKLDLQTVFHTGLPPAA